MKITGGLPQANQQGEQDPERLQRGLDVVAKKLRIAENESRLPVMKGVPGAQRNKWKQKCAGLPESSLRQTLSLRAPPPPREEFPGKQGHGRQDRGLLGQA